VWPNKKETETTSTLPTPGKRPASKGARCDARAVIAAASIAWSDGHVEGQVRRSKIVERQMYCCGSFNSYAAVFPAVAMRAFRVDIVLREPC
jgi:hypothetical protein